MDKLFTLLFQDKPCRYRLSFDSAIPALILAMDPEAQRYINISLAGGRNYLVDYIRRSQRVPDLIYPGGQTWGFGPVFETAPDQGGWPAYRIRFPRVSAGGPLRWEAAYSVTGSLWLLLDLLNSQECETGPPSGPHMIYLMTHGLFSLSGEISPTGRKLIASLPQYLDDAAEAMFLAYSTMMMGHDEPHEFRAWRKGPELIYLEVPGSACGIGVCPHTTHGLNGLELIPHNVDSPVQMLALLSGLAWLDGELHKLNQALSP